MSKSNLDLTNDDLVHELRANDEESINFFNGSEITILHKNISEPVSDEVQKEIDGLESLILSFSASKERIAFNRALAGAEARNDDLPEKPSFFIRIIEEVIRFLRSVWEWVWSLLFNRIRRAENKINFLSQRRKVNGIKTIPVKYLSSASALLSPLTITKSPAWVISSATTGLDFYKKSIIGHKKLIEFINHKPSTREELRDLKQQVLQTLGSVITSNTPTDSVYTTAVLPGNKTFNVNLSVTERKGNPFFFLHYPGSGHLKTAEWLPSTTFINSGLDLLKEYIAEIKKEQTSTTSLFRSFEQKIKGAKKGASDWTVVYYNWLIELNRKFISVTFHATMRWFDALESFVSSGVK